MPTVPFSPWISAVGISMAEFPSPPIFLLPDNDFHYLSIPCLWACRLSPLPNPHSHGSHSPLRNLRSWSWSFLLVHISLIFLCHTGWKICTYRNIVISLRGESALKLAIRWVSGREKRGQSRQLDRELPAEVRSQVIYRLWSLGIWQENITTLQQTFIKHSPYSRHVDHEVWSVNDCVYTFCKGRN